SYKTSSLDARERFSLPKEEIIPFSELLQAETGISDIVVLSTCNRTEIYFSQNKYEFLHASKLVYKTLKQFKGVEHKSWQWFYSKSNDEAVTHLFEVASGIDSMIIGEDQIIGQIKDAYVFCTDAGLTDAVLMRLFQKSFEASKRVRTETKIKMGTTSVSSAAVQKCAGLFPDLFGKKVLLIGAGETGSLVLQSLSKNGVQKLTVTNRTLEKSLKLAARHNCVPLPFDQVAVHLYLYDIVIVATGSTVPLITREMAELSVKNRNGNNQVFVDISVPRNIEQEVESLEAITLFTIDDLQSVVNTNMEKRKESVSTANEIIKEIVDDFCEWLASRSLRPAIKTITNNMSKITKGELSEYNKVNSEEIQKAIDEFSQHLTQKYTRLFIKNLKEITANGRNAGSLEIVNGLFSMEEK
ncbi:MAG TPA: glutamyl-tRNA reductase, partial [Draconibacterium sp.]|nr:glutamyl-tRNA reductase [Draconibacterium sp.]